MTLDFSDGCKVLHVPDLQHARSAGTQQHGSPGHVGQRTHPVFMGVWDLLSRHTTQITAESKCLLLRWSFNETKCKSVPANEHMTRSGIIMEQFQVT